MLHSKTIVIDIDGVIMESEGLDYESAKPIQDNIDIINKLKDGGAKIVLFTARGYKTGVDWKFVTQLQLVRFGVKYDRLMFGKPAADYYIDDKMITLKGLAEKYYLR